MKKDRNLFWNLMEPEYRNAVMFCRKLMGDRERGDDLFQDAMIIAFTRFSSLRDQASFRSWLYRVMINMFKSTVRKKWWRRFVPLTAETQLKLSMRNPIEAHAAKRWLKYAFQAVSAEEQALVTLYELEGWTIPELADLTGRTEGAIKISLFRSRRKMKEALISLSRQPKTRQFTERILSRGGKCVAAKPKLD